MKKTIVYGLVILSLLITSSILFPDKEFTINTSANYYVFGINAIAIIFGVLLMTVLSVSFILKLKDKMD